MSSDQYQWLNEFNQRMLQRLHQGCEEHGDALWNQHHLIADLEEELIDVANFAYLVYARMKVIEMQLDEYEKGKHKGL